MKNRAYIKEIFDSVNYTRKFSKGSIIYHQGDYASSFYYLKKGKVRVYMTSPDGVEHTLSTASSGEILGEAAFFDKMPRISSANALSNIEVAVINEETLLTLTRKYPKLALELLNLQATRIRQLSSQLDHPTPSSSLPSRAGHRGRGTFPLPLQLAPAPYSGRLLCTQRTQLPQATRVLAQGHPRDPAQEHAPVTLHFLRIFSWTQGPGGVTEWDTTPAAWHTSCTPSPSSLLH